MFLGLLAPFFISLAPIFPNNQQHYAKTQISGAALRISNIIRGDYIVYHPDAKTGNEVSVKEEGRHILPGKFQYQIAAGKIQGRLAEPSD